MFIVETIRKYKTRLKLESRYSLYILAAENGSSILHLAFLNLVFEVLHSTLTMT